ncbi:hypothetical protein KCG44_06220 [Pacificimonas sp. WHA3]|uniref:MPN domain-containing protein n=1 Tax=Pacificimonas pallii TaxID=2827236 RepID=A0ABS6SDP9_9SPHN|nr:JAB domain-containing protein [Pacificimonas pallii]MBV7256380.1 hypothetical protein [Pacificimonas pallii]
MAEQPDDVAAFALLSAVRDLIRHTLRREAMTRPIMSTRKALLDYLHAEISHLPTERLLVLFLDDKRQLLSEDVLAYGDVGVVEASPRQVFGRALRLGAERIVLAHNHPSGDPAPSPEDVRVTRQLATLGRRLNVTLEDHLIIGRRGWFSLRASNLI